MSAAEDAASLRHYISSDRILLNIPVADRWEALRKLVEALVRSMKLEESDFEEILHAVTEREKEHSTALGGGVAFPHARVPGFKGVALTLATFTRPVDFEAPDGKGVTHGVVIDFMAAVTISAQNGWTDMNVTYRILMTEDDDFTFVTPCAKTLGDPPVDNVMVMDGNSIPACAFEGTDPADPDNGCCNPEVCNKPGKLSKSGLPSFVAGNVNGDSRIDIADGIFLLSYLFRDGPEPPCLAAADFNGDDAVDLSDAQAIIYWRLQPDLPERPPEGWPGPAYGEGCSPHETSLPCNVPCTP